MAERKAPVWTGGIARCITVSAEFPQGSVLGLTLLNLFYDDVSRMPLPEDVTTVDYADDLALLEDLEKAANEVLGVTIEWISDHFLATAPDKAEAVILPRKNFTAPAMVVDGHQVPLSTLKYIDVTLARTLIF